MMRIHATPAGTDSPRAHHFRSMHDSYRHSFMEHALKAPPGRRPWVRRLGLLGLAALFAGCATPDPALAPGARDANDTGHGAAISQISRVPALTPASYAAHPTSIQALPGELQRRWASTGIPESALSLVIAEVGRPPIVAINPEEPRNPASVMKLVTTYAALHALGPAYTWQTGFFAGPGATVSNGRLSTPLYVKASGDPTLTTEDVSAVFRRLRARGIRVLPGIVVDRSAFGPIGIDPGAFDERPDRVYNASPDALLISSGALQVHYFPTLNGRAWEMAVEPRMSGVRVQSQLRASQGTCSGRPAVKTQVTRQSGTVVLQVSGTVPSSCGAFSLQRLVLPPAEHAARVLRSLWEDLGGQLTGPVTDGAVPDGAVLLASQESAPLATVVRQINKESDNLVARMLLLALARANGAEPVTPEQARAALQTALARAGFKFPELVVENGAGLSRQARISAASLAALLNQAWQSPRMPEFVSSLSIAGEDGTLRRRMRDGVARGAAHLKTGTLRDVSAVAGYVTGTSGKRYVVVALVNHAQAHAARDFMDEVVAWTAGR